LIAICFRQHVQVEIKQRCVQAGAPIRSPGRLATGAVIYLVAWLIGFAIARGRS
jgi:sorbitol-specific phosphotransferase system component IIBC